MQSDGLHPFLFIVSFFALLLIYTIFVLSNQDFNQNKVSRYAYHQTNYAVNRGLEKKHFKNAKETIDQVIAFNDKRRSTQSI